MWLVAIFKENNYTVILEICVSTQYYFKTSFFIHCQRIGQPTVVDYEQSQEEVVKISTLVLLPPVRRIPR
jgi:hypothetical protein